MNRLHCGAHETHAQHQGMALSCCCSASSWLKQPSSYFRKFSLTRCTPDSFSMLKRRCSLSAPACAHVDRRSACPAAISPSITRNALAWPRIANEGRPRRPCRRGRFAACTLSRATAHCTPPSLQRWRRCNHREIYHRRPRPAGRHSWLRRLPGRSRLHTHGRRRLHTHGCLRGQLRRDPSAALRRRRRRWCRPRQPPREMEGQRSR
jgi:hypothetical protein